MKQLLQQTKQLFHSTQKKLISLRQKKGEQTEEKDALATLPMHHVAPEHTTIVEISTASVTKGTLAIIGIAVLVYFLYSIQGTLVLLFVSLILAAALDPMVDRWQAKKIPRGISVIVLYLIFLAIFGAVVYALVPIMVEQTTNLIQGVGALINNILSGNNLDYPFSKELRPVYDSLIQNIDKQELISEAQKMLGAISAQLGSIAGNSLLALGSLFNGLFNAALVLVLTFFMVTDKTAIRQFITSLTPARYAPYWDTKMHQMQVKIGGWVRGQMLLCLSIGIITYLGLFFLEIFGVHIEYKETLAVVAAITEIIPYLGPVIGAIPAVLIATNVSAGAVLWVIILYVVVQTLENNVVVPMVMNKEVGLNPIVIIFAIMVGAQFFGILGILLAIPVTTSIQVLVQDYIDKEK